MLCENQMVLLGRRRLNGCGKDLGSDKEIVEVLVD